MRGERRKKFGIMRSTNGSSPHARGTRPCPGGAGASGRFIPACAGNAGAGAAGAASDSVHPRMRGERCVAYFTASRAVGSSPHARGTRKGPLSWSCKNRFIPACAGNAPVWAAARLRAAVHPRMRGERSFLHARMSGCCGSSPHARGTRTMLLRRRDGSAVHPRMRGERSGLGSRTPAGNGSSPHARGTRRVSARRRVRRRFIPACAGNARSVSTSPEIWTVHPRMRGERIAELETHRHRGGSSPHARGTRKIINNKTGADRFIPACAGNAPSADI